MAQVLPTSIFKNFDPLDILGVLGNPLTLLGHLIPSSINIPEMLKTQGEKAVQKYLHDLYLKRMLKHAESIAADMVKNKKTPALIGPHEAFHRALYRVIDEGTGDKVPGFIVDKVRDSHDKKLWDAVASGKILVATPQLELVKLTCQWEADTLL